MASLFLYVHDYSDNFRDLTSEVGFRNKFRKIYDFKAYYYKTEALEVNSNEINFYNLHQLAHPIVTYFNKDMPQKISIYGINNAISHRRILFKSNDPQVNFVYDYIFNDIKKMLKDKNTKLIFVDNHEANKLMTSRCSIGYVEHLFFDKEIKNYFLNNYKFENRLFVTKKYEIKEDAWSRFFSDKKNEFSKYESNGSYKKISSDIEVYVRKN
jgi:hypothetical protein